MQIEVGTGVLSTGAYDPTRSYLVGRVQCFQAAAAGTPANASNFRFNGQGGALNMIRGYRLTTADGTVLEENRHFNTWANAVMRAAYTDGEMETLSRTLLAAGENDSRSPLCDPITNAATSTEFAIPLSLFMGLHSNPLPGDVAAELAAKGQPVPRVAPMELAKLRGLRYEFELEQTFATAFSERQAPANGAVRAAPAVGAVPANAYQLAAKDASGGGGATAVVITTQNRLLADVQRLYGAGTIRALAVLATTDAATISVNEAIVTPTQTGGADTITFTGAANIGGAVNYTGGGVILLATASSSAVLPARDLTAGGASVFYTDANMTAAVAATIFPVGCRVRIQAVNLANGLNIGFGQAYAYVTALANGTGGNANKAEITLNATVLAGVNWNGGMLLSYDGDGVPSRSAGSYTVSDLRLRLAETPSLPMKEILPYVSVSAFAQAIVGAAADATYNVALPYSDARALFAKMIPNAHPLVQGSRNGVTGYQWALDGQDLVQGGIVATGLYLPMPKDLLRRAFIAAGIPVKRISSVLDTFSQPLVATSAAAGAGGARAQESMLVGRNVALRMTDIGAACQLIVYCAALRHIELSGAGSADVMS